MIRQIELIVFFIQISKMFIIYYSMLLVPSESEYRYEFALKLHTHSQTNTEFEKQSE